MNGDVVGAVRMADGPPAELGSGRNEKLGSVLTDELLLPLKLLVRPRDRGGREGGHRVGRPDADRKLEGVGLGEVGTGVAHVGFLAGEERAERLVSVRIPGRTVGGASPG